MQEVEAQQLEHQASQVHPCHIVMAQSEEGVVKQRDNNLHMQPQITALQHLVSIIAQPAHIGSHQSNILVLLFSCELKPSSA